MLTRITLCLLVLAGAVEEARGFSLSGQPNWITVQNGQVYRWEAYKNGQPFVLTYAVDEQFLAGEDEATRAGIGEAIAAACQSWTDATHGMIRFEPAPWGAAPDEGLGPPGDFVGAPLDEWLLLYQDCVSDPNCEIEDLPPLGWGAHIDFFSIPSGASVLIGGDSSVPGSGTLYTMQSCNLAFTGAYRDTRIRSIDIYFNSDWNWTTDLGEAFPSGDKAMEALGVEVTMCADPGHGHGPVDRANCNTLHNQWVIDLQSVLVHEIGHALGLDHPDEAAQEGGVNLDPFLWTPLPNGPVSDEVVMKSNYLGPKRELSVDDLGGVAFLYPPALYGDVDADGRIGFLDAFAALDIFERRVAPTPWAVNRVDFNTRNGKIDMDELQQLLLWVVDPAHHPPGEVPSQNPAGWGTGSLGPSTITIGGATDPQDIGVGGVVDLALAIDNPDERTVQGWDLRIRFNSDVLKNPRYAPARDFLTDSALIPMTVTPVSQGVSELRVGSLGFDQDSSPSGTLATVRFDIDLGAAAAVSGVSFVSSMEDSEVVVALPYSHSFSKDANFPDETLVLSAVFADAYLLDVDANGVVDQDDLYAFTAAPVDVNYDSVIGCDADVCDLDILTAILRAGEVRDVAGKFLDASEVLPSVQAPAREFRAPVRDAGGLP